MPGIDIKHEKIILDTCCLINLCACGEAADILAALPRPAVVAQSAADELLVGNQGSDYPDEGGKVAVNLELLIEQVLLQVVDVASEIEAELFLQYGAQLADGEAATAAIAESRDWSPVTDERKARRLLVQRAPHLQQLSTPELIRNWAEVRGVEEGVLTVALQDIERVGHYRPAVSHSEFSWWQEHCKGV